MPDESKAEIQGLTGNEAPKTPAVEAMLGLCKSVDEIRSRIKSSFEFNYYENMEQTTEIGPVDGEHVSISQDPPGVAAEGIRVSVGVFRFTEQGAKYPEMTEFLQFHSQAPNEVYLTVKNRGSDLSRITPELLGEEVRSDQDNVQITTEPGTAHLSKSKKVVLIRLTPHQVEIASMKLKEIFLVDNQTASSEITPA